MTSNRIRKNHWYDIGRASAEGFATSTPKLDSALEAFNAGKADRKAELEEIERTFRHQTEDLTTLLAEARAEKDFDKLCDIVDRLIPDD